MNKRLPTLLATLIGSALYSQYSLADDLMSQCMLGVPAYNRPLVTGSATQQPVTIHSDSLKGNYPNDAVFSGKVDVNQGNSRLLADQVKLHQRQTSDQTTPVRTVDASGNVHYDDNQVILKGERAWSDLNTKDANVWDGDYQMVDRQGRGQASQMKQRDNNRYTILENGSFTTCLPKDNSWSVAGSEIIEDHQEEVAEIWNARFKVGNVPIFYSPYLQIPIGDRRRSGFLIPNAKYGSRNGYEFLLPYYLNIAPQMDATITPHYMSKRGMQLQNEFRYLSVLGAGEMEFDILGSDRQYQSEKSARGISDDTNSKRWLFNWRHNGVYDQHWRLNVDYTKVSDKYYFNDLDSSYYSSTDSYASQKFSVGYADTHWDATLATRDFQTFNKLQTSIYRTVPQLDMNWYQEDIGPFDAHVYGQFARFTNTNSRSPEATRLHIEPTLSLPLTNGWASLNTEAKLLATHYQQDKLEYAAELPNGDNYQLKHSVNRTLPQFKVDGKLVFERDMYFAPGHTQTLEPRVQYLYTPYRNQNDIYPYDSTLLQTDYNGLFRDTTYSGLDRIASTNQLATGITTRIYDENLVERFNASIGQIYAFTKSRTGYRSDDSDTGSIMWAGDTYWLISQQWGLRGGLQYDTHFNAVALGNASIEYHQGNDRLLQLNYRYSSPEYIARAMNNSNYLTSSIYKNGISQVGATASWPIADAWSVVGAYYYDVRNNKPADQLLGLQYSSCCYAIRLGVERKLNGWQNNTTEYERNLSLNIEFRGLGSNYGLGSEQMRREGIIPYQPTF